MLMLETKVFLSSSATVQSFVGKIFRQQLAQNLQAILSPSIRDWFKPWLSKVCVWFLEDLFERVTQSRFQIESGAFASMLT